MEPVPPAARWISPPSVSGGVIAFDGVTLAVERLSPSFGGHVLVFADSGVKRSLSTSSYPLPGRGIAAGAGAGTGATRRERSHIWPQSIRSKWTALVRADILPEPLLRRVRHVVEETARVAEGRAAMVAATGRDSAS